MIDRIILALHVKCSNNKQGCEWVGELGDMKVTTREIQCSCILFSFEQILGRGLGVINTKNESLFFVNTIPKLYAKLEISNSQKITTPYHRYPTYYLPYTIAYVLPSPGNIGLVGSTICIRLTV